MNDYTHRPVLIIIAGPNGSGKTTITSQILHHEWLENFVYIKIREKPINPHTRIGQKT